MTSGVSFIVVALSLSRLLHKWPYVWLRYGPHDTEENEGL